MVNEDEKTETEDVSSTAVTENSNRRQSENNSEKQLESLVKNRNSFNNVACGGGFGIDTDPSRQVSKISQAGPRRTKSMYDHVENDFVRTGKKTYLFRLVVVGSHEEDPTELMKTTRNIIDGINLNCHDECATGFFLAYPRQFIHVLEGSEDTLNSYLSKCAATYESNPSQFQNPGNGGNGDKPVLGGKLGTQEVASAMTDENLTRTLGRVRMLVLGYFSIPDRILPRWFQTKFNPPRQVGNIEGGFRKNLFELVKTSLVLAIIMSKQPTTKNGEIDWPDQATEGGTGNNNKGRREQDLQLMQYLPSTHLIMYVMKDKPRRIKLKSPSEFIKHYWGVPDLVLTNEVDWPIPCRIAPYH